MNQSLTLNGIDGLRNNILANLRTIELNKHLIASHDRVKLQNHHNYILSTLDNMVNIKQVEMADPYNNWSAEIKDSACLDPGANNKRVVYNKDGSTRVVNTRALNATGEEWEVQFDETQLLNPPCYMMPPQNLYSIPRIQKADRR